MEEKIDLLFREFYHPGVPGASVGIIRDGKFIFNKSYGLADLHQNIPCTEFTNYRIASVSKQFTAMAIMLLKQQGLLDYEESLLNIFPDFPKMGEKITIRHLLTHTSGLINYEDIIPADRRTQLKDKDVLELLKGQAETYFPPGSQYRYSNSGYAILAMIVEYYSGKRFPEYIQTQIFNPLGMKDSLLHEEGISTVKHRAYGYKKTESGFELADQSMTSSVLGDGGVYTSLADYYKWDQSLYGEKLVHPDILKEAFTSGTLLDGSLINYGFGWRVEERAGFKLVHHNGSTCGFNTAVRRIPEKQLTLIIFINRTGNEAPQSAEEILTLLLN